MSSLGLLLGLLGPSTARSATVDGVGRGSAHEAPESDATPDGAEAAAPGAGGEPAADPAEIGELWQQAQARIDTSDYDEAIVLLTRVYDAIALDPEAEALRLRVQWALHRAHLGAHDVDREAQHLYIARDLLRKYREALPSAERERVAEAEAALADVEARIAEHEAQSVEPEPVEPEPVEPEPEPVEPEPVEPEPVEPVEPPPERPVADRTLIIGGAVAAGLGVFGLGVMAGGLGFANAAVGRFETEPEQRADARADVRRGNTIAIASGAAGGVLLIGGAVVLSLGLRRRAASRSSQASRGALVAGPGQVGLGWRQRF